MSTAATTEREFHAYSGWAFIALEVLLLAGVIACAFQVDERNPIMLLPAGLILAAFIALMPGFFVVNPNESRVLILFGRYRGTVLHNGFYWTNIFTIKKKVSLRARNLNGDKLKVNDLVGNPIEIAIVVVWRVRDTAQALFDVDDYEDYVAVQSESAVRHLASKHPYDETEDGGISLRGGLDEVALELQAELHERLSMAGVEVIEARLTHLAYAPEIAGAMLRRQQADAIIAARQKIVDGAVGMVQLALHKLQEEQVIEFDEERKAAMVSNLLVVLCSEQDTSPVINTGTLYT